LNHIGKYTVKGLIAQGASSKVYLAQDPALSIEVAIKVFNVENSAATSPVSEESPTQQRQHALSNFVKESKILHQLSSAPHIVSFMEFDFTETNQAYIVMPYYKRCLVDLLGLDNKLSTSKTLQIARQILEGLSFIHEAGLVHLDIKPANILMDDRDQIQITDFGISIFNTTTDIEKEGFKRVSELSFGIGSENFASPEQLVGLENISLQSDLYSVAALIYRCLTGRHFKQNQNLLIEDNPNIDKELGKIITRALSLEPSLRPVSAVDFAKSLNDVQKKIEEQRDTDTNTNNADPNATRVWEAHQQGHNEILKLKDGIQNTLLKEGEVSLFNFARFALLAKAELHDRFSDEWLSDYIAQIQSNLARQNNKTAAFFLWVEQINSTLEVFYHEKTQNFSHQEKQKLLALGVSTLDIPEAELCTLLENKIADACKNEVLPASTKKPFRLGLLSTVVVFTLIGVVLSLWWFSSKETGEAMVERTNTSDTGTPSIQLVKSLNSENDSTETPRALSGSDDDSTAKQSLTFEFSGKPELGDTIYLIKSTETAASEGIQVRFKLLPTHNLESKPSNNALQPLERIRMMSLEVTNELYMACVNAGECTRTKKLTTDPRYNTFSLPQHPVINVSWYDVTEKFIPWLAIQTGTTLRLPTKQEWEFAASEGVHSPVTQNASMRFSWGARMQTGKAHCKNCNLRNGMAANTTMPVASFSANNWELFDMHGNVQEWTSTCPTFTTLTGVSNAEPRCDLAIVKGGSWLSKENEMSISMDDFLKKTVRSHTTGFRLVEEVND
jgi:serine/threonine protein kinase